MNLSNKEKSLSTKLGESVFAEKLKQALKEAELKREKQQMEKANEKKKDWFNYCFKSHWRLN